MAYAGLLLVAVPFGLALARAASRSEEAERRYVLLWRYSLPGAPTGRSSRTGAGREGARPAAFRASLRRQPVEASGAAPRLPQAAVGVSRALAAQRPKPR